MIRPADLAPLAPLAHFPVVGGVPLAYSWHRFDHWHAMNAVAPAQQFISVEDYLEGERVSEVRHEYVGGHVYAMAGASDDHNRIVTNICGELRERLRGKRCEPFMADMKLKMPESEAFYYPDVLVACDPSDNATYFRERPTVVFEVLSPDTERTDQREKRFAYSLIPSLKVYVIVAQDKRQLTVLRRGRAGPWKAEIVEGRNATLKLPELKLEIPLARLYERTAAARRSA
jgi:Uma2 family endonuclease